MKKIEIALFAYGGIHPLAFESVMGEMIEASRRGVLVEYSRVSEDALISRSRSVAATRFLEDGDADVLFMLDHDIECQVGDILATAERAHEHGALVAGMYSYRALGKGHASRLAEARADFPLGSDTLIKADFLAAGFLAIPRAALRKIVVAGQTAPEPDLELTRCLRTQDGQTFLDFFRPCVIPCYILSGTHEYLSEDWAFSYRARAAGVENLIYAKPRLLHHGDFAYGIEHGVPRGGTAPMGVRPSDVERRGAKR